MRGGVHTCPSTQEAEAVSSLGATLVYIGQPDPYRETLSQNKQNKTKRMPKFKTQFYY